MRISRLLSTLFSIVFLILLSGFFRFYRIDTLPAGLGYDEAYNGNNALTALYTHTWPVFYPENQGREGLFINLQAVSISIFGSTIWALRSVAALMGVLTVVGLFFLARDLYDERHAFIASVLHSVLLWPVVSSRIGLRASMSAAVFVYLLWAALRAYGITKSKKAAFKLPESTQNRKDRSGLYWSILTGTLLGIGLNTYLAFRVVPLLLLAIIAFAWWARIPKLFTKSLMVFSIATVLTIPLAYYYTQHPETIFARTAPISAFGEPLPLLHIAYNIVRELALPFYWGSLTWLKNYSIFATISGFFFGWGAVTILRNLIGYLRKGPSWKRPLTPVLPAMWREILFVLWIVVCSLPSVFSASWTFPHSLRLIFISPVASLFIAIGMLNAMTWANSKKAYWPRWSAPLGVLVLLSVIIVQNYSLFFDHYEDDPITKTAAYHYAQCQLAWQLERTSSAKRRVIVARGSEESFGLPSTAGIIVYLTNTVRSVEQERKNIHYAFAWQVTASDSVMYIPLPP